MCLSIARQTLTFVSCLLSVILSKNLMPQSAFRIFETPAFPLTVRHEKLF